MNKRGRAPWWTAATAGLCATVLVLTGIPAAATVSPSPEPSPEPAPTVSPEPTPDGGADQPEAAPSIEEEPGEGTGGLLDAAVQGGAVGPDGAPLVMDGVVGPTGDSAPALESVPVATPDAVESQAAAGTFGAAEVIIPGASSEDLTVVDPRSLDGMVAATATTSVAAGDSIVVGAAVAPLGPLADSVFGSPDGTFANGSRPDLVAKHLPRAARGDEISVEVTPQLADGAIPGAAFAATVSLDDTFGAAWVDVAFDTSGFTHAFGGDYGERLSLMVLPACALTTPHVPECLIGIPLETRREGDGVLRAFVPADAMSVLEVQGRMSAPRLVDLGTGGLTAGMPNVTGVKTAVTGGGTIIAAVSGASSQAGSFKATDLAPKGTWGVTEPAGGFTYSIPVATPPVSAGAGPSVSLNYSSQATDGKTSASNSQAGVVGEGWSAPLNYIERLYKTCSDDGGSTQELCWDSPYTNALGEAAYVMSLQGAVQELVYTSSTTTSATYVAVSDPTLKVTRFFGTAARPGNGDNDGEYFKVETNDGSVYYFGYNPAGTTPATASVAWEPVWSNNPSEPGYVAGSTATIPNQAYRFMLDVAVDANANASTYSYASATNTYGVNKNYVRDIQLARVDYGQTFDAATGSVTAPEAKVEFDLVERCVEGAQFYDALATGADIDALCADPKPSTAASYPDVPVDLLCTGNGCSANQSPTYFSTVRLNQINTFARGASAEWVPVETTQLITAFPTTADGSARSLWLDSVYTRGWGAAGAADDVDTYLTKFSGIRLNNRVDWDMTVAVNEVPQRPMDRMRISNVFTDLGGRIDVTYAQADVTVGGVPKDLSGTRTGSLSTQVCPQGGKDGPDYTAWLGANPLTKTNSAANDQLCFAVKSGTSTNLYHNYVVTRVKLVDLVGDQPYQAHAYAYGGSPAYAKAESVLHAPGSLGDNSTYSSYRGFVTVASTAGEVAPSVTPVAAAPVVQAVDLRSGDFDGDGRADLFTADASGQWKYSSGGTGPWVNLGADSTIPLADLRFGDFNGDAKTDVFSRTAAGQWRYASAASGAWINLTGDSGTPLAGLQFADFNGDGKTDVFSRSVAGVWRYSSGGSAGYVDLATEGATPVADLRFGDFNADGKDDVFSRTPAGQWRFSSGGSLGYQNLTSDSNVPLAALRLADVNGDRKADIVTQNADGTWKFSSGGTGTWAPLGVPQGATLAGATLDDFTGDGKSDLMIQEASGERKLWKNGAASWATVIAPVGTTPTPTVSTVTTNQYFRGTGATVASLHDGSSRQDADPRLQGMLESSSTVDGAGAVVATSKATYSVTEVATPSRDRVGVTAEHNPHVVQTTASESTSREGAWSTTATNATVFQAGIYQPVQSTSTIVDSRFPSEPETQCSATDYASSTAPYMVVPVESRSYDGTCTGGTMTGKVQIGYDGGGPGATDQLLVRGLVTAERSYSEKDTFSTVKAAYDAKGRIVAAWMPNDLDDPEASGVPADAPTVTWEHGSDPMHPELWTTKVTRALGATSTTWTERGHGNAVKSRGATAGDWTHYQYDALGLMVAGWSPLQWGFEDAPSLAEDIPTVMYRYDIYANGPTLRSTPAVITTAPFVGDTGTSFPAHDLTGTTRRTMTFLDGLGRAIEQHAVAPDGSGGRTVSATRYNALGQVDWSSSSFAAVGSMRVLDSAGKSMLVNRDVEDLPTATDYIYDTRGRTTATTSLTFGAPLTVGGAQVRTTYAYSGPTTTVTTPNGATTTTTADVLGRTTSKVIGPDTANAAEPSQETAYAYSTLTAVGKLGFQQVTVTDVEGEATVFESNLAGQRTAMVDPNAGTTTYLYDDNGQTSSVTSPAGTITMSYDALGRLVSRDTGGSSSATWEYVEPGDVGAATDLGLLRSSSSTTHTSQGDLTTVTSAVYDALHRPVSSSTTLPASPLLGDLSGESYTTTASYDAIGQPLTSGLPAMGGLSAETITTGYRLSGSPEKLTLATGGVSTPLVTGVGYSGTGQLTSRTYANGVTRAYEWDSATRALTGLSASFVTDESGSTQTAFVQKDAFTRDVMGRIVQSTNEVPVSDGSAADGEVTAECFAYDGFNRLAGAWTVAGTGSATCGGAAPADAAAAGWDASTTAYAAQWSYSAGGRITSLVKGAGADAVTSTYAYEDAAHPAAVTGVTSDEVSAGEPVVGVSDDFESNSYSGGTGSRWTTDWVEFNDDDDATNDRSGAVWINAGTLCLVNIGGTSDPGLSRTIDVTGADSAILDLNNLVQSSGAAFDSITVTVTADGDPSRQVARYIAPYGYPQLPGSIDVSSLLPASSLEVTLSRPASGGYNSKFCLDGLSVDLTGTVPAVAVPDAFTYDSAGRMISRTVDGVETTLTWDVTSYLTESMGQGGHVLYAYDAGGQRVAQVRLADADGPGTATAYVASGQVEDSDTAPTSTGVVTATRYYTFAGSTVAVRTEDGAGSTKLALMLGDEQGSTSVMMPVTVTGSGALASATLADALAVTRTSYTPYGELRGADNLAVDRGWLGQVEDRVSADGVSGTGLTYLNARYYDPATGRFISPDPLMNPGDPRTLDPYRYADNNPVSFVDPTGLEAACAHNARAGGRSAGCQDNASRASVVGKAQRALNWCLSLGGRGCEYHVRARDDARNLPPIKPRSTMPVWEQLDLAPAYNEWSKGREQQRQRDAAAGHFVLDVLGLAPGVGEWADGANAGWYESEGNHIDAGLSGASAVPIVGWGSTASKWFKSIFKWGDDVTPRTIVNVSGLTVDTSRVTIPGGKFDYLLESKAKAGVFSDSMGFDVVSLEQALRAHLVDNFDTASTPVKMYGGGTKFEVTGPMTGPSGETWTIVTAWGIDVDGSLRLITATPPS